MGQGLGLEVVAADAREAVEVVGASRDVVEAAAAGPVQVPPLLKRVIELAGGDEVV